MENDIPTAEEFFYNHKLIKGEYETVCFEDIPLVMKEFAKLHCEQQLKAILDNRNTVLIDYHTASNFDKERGSEIWQEGNNSPSFLAIVNTNSIITAYDSNSIK